jgi:lysyl-tRNA synthetase class 2
MADQTQVTPELDENAQIALRKQKLAAIREQGVAFPNDFRRDTLATTLQQQYGDKTKAELEANLTPVTYKVAGRIVLRRLMGKASFITLQDMSGKLQVYVRQNDVPEGMYDAFKTWDLGDIVGVEGHVFKTNTGELSIHAKTIHLLTKSLRPLPDKYHGLADQELRYRQRYVDLIVNEEARKVFVLRSKVVEWIRRYLTEHHFMEVETPMMQVIPGGATARPFKTHHNALDMDMYLRIAPELYLKRLVVGGFERVFEINRNFRNEGLSTRHNPEFTMLEFYQAYADYRDLMDLTEDMLRRMSTDLLGKPEIQYQGHTYDLSKPFARMSVVDSILHYNPTVTREQLHALDSARQIAQGLGIKLEASYGLGKVQIEIFEKTVESNLMAPTFITEYPAEVSPLARANDQNPFITDRFEFFMGGREIANGFSELNDAEDQALRFRAQVAAKESGDEEAMHYDADYVTALEYGMPPTAGEGIGIDRLVMLFADQPSIRDVILFPHMRPNNG